VAGVATQEAQSPGKTMRQVLSRCRREPWALTRAYLWEGAALTTLVAVAITWRPPTFTLDWHAGHLVFALAAVPFGWWVSSAIHNAGHGNFPRLLNRVMGEFAGAWLGYGFTNFALIHGLHHAYTDSELDPVSPRGHAFWRYWVSPLGIPTAVARRYLRQVHGAHPRYTAIAVGEVVLFNLNLGLRLALWFVLFGPAGFLAFYGVSIASNVTILAHINYACHRDAPDGDVHIVNLDGTLYYRLANAITSGGYFHKSHHDHPHLFDPRSVASETPVGGRAGYFDLEGLWGNR
jgi:Fatty acid desaturase